MSLLANIERRYVYIGAGIGIIGYIMANIVLKHQSMSVRKIKYYHQTVLLLHIKHQIGSYLPLILSSASTLCGCYIYSQMYQTNSIPVSAPVKYNSNNTLNLNIPIKELIKNPSIFVLPKYKKIFFIFSLNFLVIKVIKDLYSYLRNMDPYKKMDNKESEEDTLYLYEHYIESSIRNEIIHKLSRQILLTRNCLKDYCIENEIEIGPEIREEILSYVGIPMFNENEYKSLIDVHEYVSNDLKRKFVYDDQVYDTNYDLIADWKTKAVVHVFVAAEVIQFCCKWIQ